ncbi:MAG: serine/threonine protein kinase, partial [Pirellulales bacterium]|nr:serine/threonine protein kinase [Pirellulales bacterium]
MTPQEIFLRASEIEAGSERAEYLDTACGDDVDLRAKVDSLLTTLESSDSNDGTEVGDDATVDRSNVATAGGQVGKMIGAYKLLQQIGEGGFGVVYMAEQVEPIRRKVALKIVKPGMDTKDVIARFEAERQALALMDHPNIAKVLDGGVTEFGRPYFVMELVKGVPITEFCDKNKLSTQQRIDLFLTVCRAIDHAHGKGIIHRDIKPSNVMVTLHDGKPVCKVIDFGVSKALSQQLTEKTLFTAYGQMIGTPTYMSPEQAEMSGLDIDTRSDVYSLGVVLYELLTGTTPLGKQEVQSATYDELQRMIKEEEAQRPSTRVSTLGKKATINAKNRSTEERKLSQQLRGDIDWIVIKALEKDRNRRYDSAKAMAEDLERHARQEPVLARPPSLIYRAQKFLRRNRIKVGVFATVGVLALVVLSSGVVLFESREEQTKLQEQADELAQEKAALETQVSSIEEARRLLREDVPKLKKDFKNATLYQLLMQIKPLLEEDADYIAAFDEHF